MVGKISRTLKSAYSTNHKQSSAKLSRIQAAETNGIFSFQTEADLEEFEIQLGRGEIDAIIILPPDFGTIGNDGYPRGELQLLYNQSDEQLSLSIIAILEGIFDEINQTILAIERPLTIKSQTPANRQFE